MKTSSRTVQRAMKVSSFIFLSSLFALLFYFGFTAITVDIVDDFTGQTVEQTRDVESIANSVVLIFTIAIIASMGIALLLGDVDLKTTIFALGLTLPVSLLEMGLISLTWLQLEYPALFGDVTVQQFLIANNYYNMLFLVYILSSADAYFIMLYLLMFFNAMTYLYLLDAFA